MLGAEQGECTGKSLAEAEQITVDCFPPLPERNYYNMRKEALLGFPGVNTDWFSVSALLQCLSCLTASASQHGFSVSAV